MTQNETLAHYHFGSETGVPLLLVHGLFGSARNWRAIARHLSRNRWVVTVDLRNHGDSFWHDDNSYDALADDLAQLIQYLGGRADVMGHSMGGKAAMVLALKAPTNVRNLMIADIAPVAYAHTQNHQIDIMEGLPLDGFDRRSSAQKWLEDKTEDASLAAFFAQSLSFDYAKPKWILNLTALRANMEDIIGFPPVTGMFEKPALFIRGGASSYVDDASIAKIKHLFPHASIETLDGAGHWLHAEMPREFMKIVDDYLS